MAKYDVTNELAEIIKSTRIQNHISSKSVAEHIGKSQSYMSKLEKGDIKSIDESELTSIFKFIFNSDEDFQIFLNTTLYQILKTLDLRFTDDEIDEQLWFCNYDTVLRLIPIPEELIDNLNYRINTLNLSISELCSRINSNEGIDPQITNVDAYPFNEWQAFVVNHKIEFSFIKMKVQPSEIEGIINKTYKSSNYVTMQAIVYYLLKIEEYDDKVDISGEENTNLMAETVKYLNSYKFFSLAEKRKLKNQAKSKTELDNLLSTFDKDNIALINEILTAFKLFSELDIAKTNEFLSHFVKNLKWDNGFMMRLISIELFNTVNLSFALKKNMLSEIQAVVKKYNDIPDEQKNIEIYD